MNVHAIQLGSAQSQPELSQILRGVDERVAIRHRQGAVHVGVLVEQFNDIAQRGLDVAVVRPDRRDSDKVDRRGELVVDPVVLFAEKRMLAQGRRTVG
jgi:hypothetical protein